VLVGKALAVALRPLGTLQDLHTPAGGNGAGDPERRREDDIDQLPSLDIDWSNFPVSTLSGRSALHLKSRWRCFPRVDWQAQKREKPGKHDADRQQRRGNGPSNERDGGVHSGWPAVRPHRR
jgi:hypothetical protein